MKIDYNSWIGVKKGKMTVTGIAKKIGYTPMLNGKCDCGQERVFSYSNFKRGNQLSCGCNRTPKTVSYDYGHPLYKIWVSMRARCNNSNDSAFKDYGARGVVVCELWDNDYQLFYDWCISNGWRRGLFVDKDTKGTGLLYSPEMCAIITRAENNQARRCVKMNFDKVREIRKSDLNAHELAEIYSISYQTIYDIKAGRTWKLAAGL